jgi:heme oxygenase
MIRIVDDYEEDVTVTSSEYWMYSQNYIQFLKYYSGSHITLEEYIRNQKRNKQAAEQEIFNNQTYIRD